MKMIAAITIFCGLALMFACCSSERKAIGTSVSSDSSVVAEPMMIPSAGGHYRDSSPRGMNAVMPKARIYRTNGDYRLNVPITLDSSRTEIVSYPGPSDIDMKMAPVVLDDGWLLDRRGVGVNTAFT
ncbi:MAG: hypothetical protein K2O12_00920, partial [Muribaculaceae bacterium]|nr:hypothetical protein [Muribaculaceae bacterium]